MELRCNCGFKQFITIHKDGYEVVKFVCDRCKRPRRTYVKDQFVIIQLSYGFSLMVEKPHN